jgi:hypothetical protein
MGSLTGAVHLSNDNAGVLRPAQGGQKPPVEQKGKCRLDPDFQYEYGPRKARPIDPFGHSEFEARGVRKVTTGITGLWRPSVHSDVAF